MNKKLSVFLVAMTMPFVAIASKCDDSLITVIGPSNYQYSMVLSQGSLNQKNNHVTQLSQRPANLEGNTYYVFSAKKTLGQIRGSINFIDPDTKENSLFTIGFVDHQNTCSTHLGYIKTSKDFLVNVSFPTTANHPVFKISKLKA